MGNVTVTEHHEITQSLLPDLPRSVDELWLALLNDSSCVCDWPLLSPAELGRRGGGGGGGAEEGLAKGLRQEKVDLYTVQLKGILLPPAQLYTSKYCSLGSSM